MLGIWQTDEKNPPQGAAHEAFLGITILEEFHLEKTISMKRLLYNEALLEITATVTICRMHKDLTLSSGHCGYTSDITIHNLVNFPKPLLANLLNDNNRTNFSISLRNLSEIMKLQRQRKNVSCFYVPDGQNKHKSTNKYMKKLVNKQQTKCQRPQKRKLSLTNGCQ